MAIMGKISKHITLSMLEGKKHALTNAAKKIFLGSKMNKWCGGKKLYRTIQKNSTEGRRHNVLASACNNSF